MAEKSPLEIVESMLAEDQFSRWLGLRVEEVSEGYCRVSMVIREEMLNGFGILHGGLTFAMADSCFAFACNTRGSGAISIQASMNFSNAARKGETLVAESREVHVGRTSAVYDIEVRERESDKLIGVFRGMAHRKPDSNHSPTLE